MELFNKLSSEHEVLSSDSFKKFAETAEKQLNELNAVLMNDESCLSEKGKIIARERNLWRAMLKAFGVEANDVALKSLKSWFEEKIKQ